MKALHIQHADTVDLYIHYDLQPDGSSHAVPEGYDLIATLYDKNMAVIREYSIEKETITAVFPGYVIHVAAEDSKLIDNIGYLKLTRTNEANGSIDQANALVRILGDLD